MNIDNLWAEIESEHSWRIDEIRFFQNNLNNLDTEDKQDQFRRATILMLYAHFEGFVKFCFNLYVNSINKESIKCKDVNSALVAATLSNLFYNLRNPEKSKEFKRELPDDSKLHRFARDREFVEHSLEFYEREVKIPEDVVDTESNLKPVVLRKNLYRLGFPHDQFKNLEGEISKLLEFRNKISHGMSKMGIDSKTYNSLRDATFKIMDEVKRGIMDALTHKRYLKNQTA